MGSGRGRIKGWRGLCFCKPYPVALLLLEFISIKIFRAIGGNPLHCDCKLSWLAEWIQVGSCDRLSSCIFSQCVINFDMSNSELTRRRGNKR